MVLVVNTSAIAPIGEKRITLRNLDWQAYQQLRTLLENRSRVQFTYDSGTLELTMPLEEHESAARLIDLFIHILVVELGLKIKTMGSTTLDREDLEAVCKVLIRSMQSLREIGESLKTRCSVKEKTPCRESLIKRDLSDDEWEKIKPLLPEVNKLGSPRTVDLREVLNAIFYRVDHGCKWRALPHDFPPHQTVYDYFRRWVRTGLWQNINQAMVRQVRVFEGRDEEPTLAIIDSHSAKGTSKGVPQMALMGIKR